MAQIEMILVSSKEYADLKRDSEQLAKLHAAGVDNWEWYSHALYGDIDDPFEDYFDDAENQSDTA